MNHRQRILSLLEGKTPDRVPWLGDLAYWSHAMEKRGEVPAGFQKSEAYYAFHRDLGVGFYLQGYWPFETLYDDSVRVSEVREGNRRWRGIETPAGSLSEVWTYLPESFSEAPTERLIKTRADLATLRCWFEHTHYRPDYAEAQRRYRLVQDLGIVLCYLPRSPLMELVAVLCGIETLVDLWIDAPAELEETLRIMERKHDEAAAIALESPAECLMIPENLSSEVVGRTLFTRYAREYEQRWTERIRAAGKRSFIHMDGTLAGLISQVAANGFDVIEAVTPSPVGDLSLEQMRERVGPGTILWGGLPGVYFTALVSDEAFERFVRQVLETMTGAPRYVLGVADQVPPDGLRRRVTRVGELVERYGAYHT